VISLAEFAEMQGAIGVVLNAPTSDDVVEQVSQAVDIPTVITVVREDEDIDARVAAGASILNVSGASKTADIVRKIRQKYHDIPIIATGGPTEESIRKTIEAGANAITWTPPSNGEIFKDVMAAYRKGEEHP
jgi:2-keto-3-deoxy-6-phosphogluconate aldolase